MIGRKLKVARSAAGLSLRDLSDRIGNRVSAQAIGKYERNEDMPGSAPLLAIAKALDVQVDYLLSADEIELEGVDFRKKALTSAREEAKVEAGASLVQIYTGFIYRGPALIGEARRALR